MPSSGLLSVLSHTESPDCEATAAAHWQAYQCSRLLIVHGRNSYKRSAALGQYVMRRSLISSTMQVQYLVALKMCRKLLSRFNFYI
ncbi:UNVERIFIED_CONTAM: hypothetical protein FKN15_035302 [Acipenser sinensis]